MKNSVRKPRLNQGPLEYEARRRVNVILKTLPTVPLHDVRNGRVRWGGGLIQQKIQVLGEKLIPVAYFVQHKPNTEWRGTIVRGDRPATDSSTLTRIDFSSPGTQMSAKHTSVQMVCAGQSRVRRPGWERDFPEVFPFLWFYAAQICGFFNRRFGTTYLFHTQGSSSPTNTSRNRFSPSPDGRRGLAWGWRGGYFPRTKRPGLEGGCPLPSSAVVKSEGRCTSDPPVRFHGMCRDNFTCAF